MTKPCMQHTHKCSLELVWSVYDIIRNAGSLSFPLLYPSDSWLQDLR